MNVHRRLAALLLLALLAGCDSLVAPRAPGSLSVAVHPPSLVLTNHADQPAYLLAFEQETAALSLWGPCHEPQPCPSVAPGARIHLPFDRIAGYRAEQPQTVIVYWWHLVPAPDGGFRPDSIRTVHVQLP